MALTFGSGDEESPPSNGNDPSEQSPRPAEKGGSPADSPEKSDGRRDPGSSLPTLHDSDVARPPREGTGGAGDPVAARGGQAETPPRGTPDAGPGTPDEPRAFPPDYEFGRALLAYGYLDLAREEFAATAKDPSCDEDARIAGKLGICEVRLAEARQETDPERRLTLYDEAAKELDDLAEGFPESGRSSDILIQAGLAHAARGFWLDLRAEEKSGATSGGSTRAGESAEEWGLAARRFSTALEKLFTGVGVGGEVDPDLYSRTSYYRLESLWQKAHAGGSPAAWVEIERAAGEFVWENEPLARAHLAAVRAAQALVRSGKVETGLARIREVVDAMLGESRMENEIAPRVLHAFAHGALLSTLVEVKKPLDAVLLHQEATKGGELDSNALASTGAAYWYARALEAAGRGEDARLEYERLARSADWWGVRAQARLGRPAPPESTPALDPPLELLLDPLAGAGNSARWASSPRTADAFSGRVARRESLLSAEGGTGTQAAVDMGLRWLAAHQDKSRGRWDSDDFQPQCKKNTCSGRGAEWCDPGQTGLALLAFLGAGHTHQRGKYRETVKLALQYLKNIQDQEGCFGPRNSNYMYNHAIACLSMAEAYGMTKSPILEDSAQKGIDFIVSAQNPGFAWRYKVKPGDNDTSVTGWAVMALKSARVAELSVPPNSFAGALSWLDAVTDEESHRTGYIQKGDTGARLRDQIGKFSSCETCTAISIISRIFAGVERKEPLVKRQGDLLSQRLPTWDTNGGAGGKSKIDFYYWYYGTLAMFQLGGDYWKTWNESMKSAIVSHQRKDGDERGSWDAIDAWGTEGGRVYATAINVLALETYYRYPREER
ncbi:MAG: hypothetical protein HY720_07095 [Planctomycetes bacterium]|nr:hypothetical protein [Planctomycetota bacterium]